MACRLALLELDAWLWSISKPLACSKPQFEQGFLNPNHIRSPFLISSNTLWEKMKVTHLGAAERKRPCYERRIKLFEECAVRERAKVDAAKAAAVPIIAIMPDGSTRSGVQGVTTPFGIANEILNSFGKKCVVARVDGKDWDLTRPLEDDCTLQLFSFEDEEGRDAFWHSSAHLLGQALELEFGVDLTIGPALGEGFYYDCFMGDRTLAEADRKIVEKRIEQSIKENQRFERAVVTREEALSMFEENRFKVELINSFPGDAVITVYRVGPMVDLCSGPHLPNTSLLKVRERTIEWKSHRS